MNAKYSTIDEYIEGFPEKTRQILMQVRKVIKDNAPGASEAISYQMPTFRLKGNLVHFAAYANHIGLYPAPSAIVEFKDKLTGFKHAKGSVQFPLDKPIPYDLIAGMVKFRVKEQMSPRSN